MNQRIFLSPPHIGEAEAGFVAEAFASNWIAPLGPNVDAFEQEIASYVGAQGAVALSSGTAAIHLALRLLGVGRGDIVFVSSLTFIASVNPVLYEGAVPVFIDADETTWNMSPAALQRALEDARRAGRMPKAVIVVSLYGQSADMAAITELCEQYGVPIVEDAAESLGATYQGSASGTFGRFGIYSFNGNKIMTTSGGGMLIGQDLEALKLARFWATQSRDQALHYEHSQLGFNYRMSNVLAGIGRGQLQVLDSRIEARRAIFERYVAAFSGIEGIDFMPEAPYGRSTRWLTAMTLDPDATGTTPEALVHALMEANIEARPVWKPMHLQPLLRECAYYPHTDLPQGSVSDQLFARGICLPSGSSLTIEQQNRVIDCIHSHLADSRKLASVLAAHSG
ncbi:pyridoxal phosphate-dependent aminotransferase EpsN [Paenibacillus cellulosilyticus]|uniref:Pyridoxal phosphate-dependent aminotransferase EpsN n=1 Tax=Paenibacillus cellulosilyticus TaxID=375489 RepID=A0A2V2YZ51_9BACL|nr:aminotransferase class I/II-fold pyridoxal phosphate-dependent enzyme [Paenibacillus cellulosilyticus]PWW07538.1 pyridoxal phosphate-dependent aminotransferase EpsN [Paenibacillus cellulosilyticus]QKS44311.1 aminotransferase class I/II-fold pyridoxal phosphate-dependent enzyme [Paenibacillus cellulosilyticus]